MEYEFDGSEVTYDILAPFDPINKASSNVDALKALHGAVENLGFEQMMFAVMPQPKADPGNVFMLTSYDSAWREFYDKQKLIAVDPTVEYCFKTNTPLVWMPQSFKTSAQQSLYEEASSFGLRVGVTLPIHGLNGEVGMLTCVRDQAPGNAFLKDLGAKLGELSLLRDVAYESLSKFMITEQKDDEPPPVLTARELDCLQWMAAGKTAWEVGRILGISEAGVNFHFSNLRTKFGVTKRNDVVVKAIRMGLVQLPR